MDSTQPKSQDASSTTKAAPFWATTLYYAQGLPFSIVRQMAVVFFKDQGVSLQSLGFVSLYGIPWTFKFLWSPLVDTFSTKRQWVVVMEFLLAMVVAILAILIGRGITPFTVACGFLVVAFFSATHDIAVDGFYLEAFSKSEQAKFSGWIVAAYRVALLSGSGLLIGLSGKIGWPLTFGAVAGTLYALFFWHYFMLPKIASPKAVITGPAHTPWLNIFEGFKEFFKLPGIGLAITFTILFKLGDALLFGMSSPFLLDSGLSKAQLGLYSGVFGIVAGISASIFGGWFISNYKLRRGLWFFGIIQNVSIPLYAFVAWTRPEPWVLGVAVVVEQIAAGLGTAAYSNFLMRQNNPKYKATHYSIATGLMSLTTMLGGILSGFGAQKYGYAMFFSLAFLASLPGLCLIPFVARRPECQ